MLELIIGELHMKIRKNIFYFLIFLLIIYLNYFFVFKKYSFNDLVLSLSYCNPIYIVLSVVAMFSWAFFESLYLRRMLGHLGYKVPWYNAFGYVATETYFSAITPSSMGGQPVQMMEMSRDGILYRVNSVVILLNTLIYKIALLTLATLGFIFYHDILLSFGGWFYWLVLLGYITTVLVVILFIVLVYSKRLMEVLLKAAIWLMKKVHYKKASLKEKELKDVISGYQDVALFTKEHPFVLVEAYFILIMQRLSILVISYFIYRSFGFHEYSIFLLIAFQACVCLGSDFMPFPGGVVVSESLLLTANEFLYGSSLAASGMVLLRSVSFYGVVLFSIIFYIIFRFRKSVVVK